MWVKQRIFIPRARRRSAIAWLFGRLRIPTAKNANTAGRFMKGCTWKETRFGLRFGMSGTAWNFAVIRLGLSSLPGPTRNFIGRRHALTATPFLFRARKLHHLWPFVMPG